VSTAQMADLVLEGGGVKGIGLVGAISVLEERGWMFNRVAGASAGAIVGSLVAAGYSASELRQIMNQLDYRRFRDEGSIDKHLGVFGQALSLIFERGVYKGEYLKRFLGEKLATKNKATFGDLLLPDENSSLASARQYALVVMVSDISHGCLRRLPWDFDHYQSQGGAHAAEVVEAVRASMSIPFFYEPVPITGADGLRCWLVDGGMLSNFPIDTFDRDDDLEPRWPTIGIKLSARPSRNEEVDKPIHGTIDMAKALISTMTSFHDRIHLDDPATLERTIFVDTTGVKATDFDLSAEKAEWLYQNGRAAAVKFLDGTPDQPKWDWGRWLDKHWTPNHAAPAPSASTGQPTR
jgi:NTE family protein